MGKNNRIHTDRLTRLSNAVAYVCRLLRKEARRHVPSSRQENVRQAAVSAGCRPSPARPTAAEGVAGIAQIAQWPCLPDFPAPLTVRKNSRSPGGSRAQYHVVSFPKRADPLRLASPVAQAASAP